MTNTTGERERFEAWWRAVRGSDASPWAAWQAAIAAQPSQEPVRACPYVCTTDNCLWPKCDGMPPRAAQPERARAVPLDCALRNLLDAAGEAQCGCTLRQRDSGHLVGCWMPALKDALEAYAAPVALPDSDS